MRSNLPAGATHFPALVDALEKTYGSVLELGAGYFSTPFLHSMCEVEKRELVTYENNQSFLNHFKAFESPTHKIIKVDNWDDIDIERPWDVVLVDHAPAEQRAKDILRLKNHAKFIVVHDTDPKYENDYHFQEVLRSFEGSEIHNYTRQSPHTTIIIPSV